MSVEGKSDVPRILLDGGEPHDRADGAFGQWSEGLAEEPLETIREVDIRDLREMYELRRETEVAKYSLKPPPTWEDHCKYINKVIAGYAPMIWVAIAKGKFAGCVSRGKGWVNIMVAPHVRGKGIGQALLRFMQADGLELRAMIHRDNLASHRLFQSCGFNKTGEQDNYDLYEWRKT